MLVLDGRLLSVTHKPSADSTRPGGYSVNVWSQEDARLIEFWVRADSDLAAPLREIKPMARVRAAIELIPVRMDRGVAYRLKLNNLIQQKEQAEGGQRG